MVSRDIYGIGKPKTYKRELAVALQVVLDAFFVGALRSDRAFEEAQYLTMPVFLLAATAFGMDSFAKQIKGAM